MPRRVGLALVHDHLLGKYHPAAGGVGGVGAQHSACLLNTNPSRPAAHHVPGLGLDQLHEDAAADHRVEEQRPVPSTG